MKKEELIEVKGAITALIESLSNYISCNGVLIISSDGVYAYWKTYEEYEKFNHAIVDACNTIEKELNNDNEKMKKIDKEKSVVYSQWNDHVSLGIKGTFVNDFDRPDDYYEGTLWSVIADVENPFMDRYGNGYKYFVPSDTKVLVKELNNDRKRLYCME